MQSMPANELDIRARAIDTIVFDLGNVLIDWNPRHLYRKLFDGDEARMEWFLREVCHSEWNERQDAGRTWAAAIEEAIARHPDEAAFIRAYRERWEEMLGGAIDETVALLDALRGVDVRLLALTNWSHETFPIALERYDFLSWFEGILVSGAEGLIKPDPAIFRLLITRFALDPARTLFIDDNPRNVEGARQVGLQAVPFTSAQQLRADLAASGVSVEGKR
jgi:2-haloacid dehalogenase